MNRQSQWLFEVPPIAQIVGVGSAILTLGQQVFRGGSFSTTSNPVNYVHDNTSPDRKSELCTREFRIMAAKPGAFPVETLKNLDLGENFWFQLSYTYNGNDLINVVIEPLVGKSSDLSKSEFKIAFTGNAYSLPRDPVSEIVFRINGTWKAWDPIPYMDTIVSFSGNLYVRADGSVRVENFKSEKGLVWFRGITSGCKVMAPFVAKVPARKPFFFNILFPLNKDHLSDKNVRLMNEWIKSWPRGTREKVARGEIVLTVIGFASRPGKRLYNFALSGRRAESVKKVLRKLTGSNTNVNILSSGEYDQNLPDLFDIVQWLKRFFDPKKYDQSVVIRFEDVE
jgi:hypothetical protein